MIDGPMAAPPARVEAGPGTHMFLFLCVALVVGFFLWAYFGKLDVVSDALGEVVPSSQVKSVQNLEGGIVREILVREGDTVTKDQSLVVLESTASGADVQEMMIGITALRVDVTRLEAEMNRTEAPKFDNDLVQSYPNLVREAMEMFRTRRRLLENQLASQGELVSQRREEILQISSRLDNERESLTLLKEQIGISEELLKDDLTNRMIHLNLLKEASDLKGKVGSDGAALRRAKAAHQESRLKLSALKDTSQEEVRREFEEKRRSLEERNERMLKFEDSLQRRILRSPVDGVVKTFYVYTVGGVVKPGETVLDVVPAGDRLIIEARLPTQDVGYVHPGQTAIVTLASQDAMRFGHLLGEVVNVSPDALDTSQGIPYYKIRIKTDHDFFEGKGARYKLVPGVQVQCSIRTGQRSVLQYLLDPFLGGVQKAMRER